MKDGGIDYDLVGCSMADILRLIVATYVGAAKRGRRPRSLMTWGAPGAGKTMTVYAAAHEIARILDVPKCEVYAMPTSCLEPTDVAGVPTPIEIGGITRYTSYLPPRWAWFCSEEYEEYERGRRAALPKSDPEYDPDWNAPPAILFFDDIPAAHFQTQTAFFKGVHEGQWGDLQQRENVMVVGAGNRVEDNAGANDMPTALANRFVHLRAKPSTEGWIEWAQKADIHPFVVGYIRKNRGHLHEFDEEVANRADKAFASPRTWEMVSDFLWEGEIDRESDDVFSKVIMGLIGRGIATGFGAYLLNTVKIIAPEVICKNPHKAKVPARKALDCLHATIASLEHHIREHPQQWKAGVIYATRDEMSPDFGVILANTIIDLIVHNPNLTPDERAEAMGSEELEKLFDRYQGSLEMIAEI